MVVPPVNRSHESNDNTHVSHNYRNGSLVGEVDRSHLDVSLAVHLHCATTSHDSVDRTPR